MQKKKPTLQDVADAVGVSTATISRSLNQPEKVRAEMRERIEASIQSLGYVPDGAARALASKRTKTIGAVVPTIDNDIFADAIQYLQKGLAESGYTLLIASSGFSPDEELRELQSLLTRGIDGIVLVGELHLPEVFSSIKRYNIPYVNLWIYNPNSKHSCIGFDHIKAGAKLAEHLFDLGHKQVGSISGILDNNDRATQRLEGVRGFFKQHDLDIPVERIIECRYSAEQGRMAIHTLLDQHPTITAILCGNDVLALGALCGARERTLKVPDDVSITGFDNMKIVKVLSPALTTVNSPSRRIGAHAAEYLINKIEGKRSQLLRLEIDADLVVRETTGPVRKNK